MKKKAALCLVQLIRKAPSSITISDPSRILQLIDNDDLGFVTSICPLIESILTLNSSLAEKAAQLALAKLCSVKTFLN